MAWARMVRNGRTRGAILSRVVLKCVKEPGDR